MIKNIILDIGNVLITYDWRSYLDQFHFDPEEDQVLADAIFCSEAWADMDRSELPQSLLEPSFVKNAPRYAEDVRRVFRDCARTVIPREYAIPWIQSLKASGLNVYYLSNYSKWMREDTDEALDFIPYTDGGLFSYEVHQSKPGEDIFQSFLKRFPQVKPEESVFFDDNADNIATACRLGFHGIVFTTKESAEKQLEIKIKKEETCL